MTETKARTRQNLIDAFWAIYKTKRIEKITVKEITTKAGYNRGTFYEYFTDVYDLLDKLEQEIIPSVYELPSFGFGQLTSAPIDSFMNLYEKHTEYYSVLLGENGDPAFAGKVKQQIKTALLNVIDFPERDVLNFTLEYILSAMVGVLNYWYTAKHNISKEQLAELLYKLSEKGIGGVIPENVLMP